MNTRPDRLVSLDVLRGLIIAAMILVNNPGNGDTSYWPLQHANWNGWTPTDLIFPSFVFMMGVAITLAVPARLARGATPASLTRHMILRFVALFAIGLVVNAFPHFVLHTWRIPGVLQRIAACYLVGGLLYLWTRRERRTADDGLEVHANVPVLATIAVCCLVAYWALLTFVPVPGYGAGRLDPVGNLGAYIDRIFLSGHMWGVSPNTWDPEGILSTLPSFGSVLAGILCGEWMRTTRPARSKAAWLLCAGVVLMICGQLLHPFFPINKKLWTSTFVLLTSGFTSIALAILFWIVDIQKWRRWAGFLLVFGTNAILAYTLSEFLNPILDMVPAGGDENLSSALYHGLMHLGLNTYNASVGYSLVYVAVNWLMIYPLYRKRIFVRL